MNPGTPQLMTASPKPVNGNASSSVGTGGSLNASYLAHLDSHADERFRIRIDNGGANDFTNFPVIAGYIGLNADFDLNAFFDNVLVSLPDVTMSIDFGSGNSYHPNGSSDGAYSQVAARFAHTATRLGRLSIRTNDENNLVGNRFKQYHQRPSLDSVIAKRINLDDSWEHPNGTPSTFNHVIEDTELIFIAEQQALLIETIKAGSYIELEFNVPFYESSKWYDPNTNQ